jgi:hypothetical protein
VRLDRVKFFFSLLAGAPTPQTRGGIRLAKARERRINVARLPTEIHFSRLSASRPFRTTRHRYVNQPVWANSRDESPRQTAHRNRAQIPDSFNYPLDWGHRPACQGGPTTPTLPPPPPAPHASTHLLWLFRFSTFYFFKRVGARAYPIIDACTSVGAWVIDIDYGPGTRSFHIRFHFITHAYEGHNLHPLQLGMVYEKNGSVSSRKKKSRCTARPRPGLRTRERGPANVLGSAWDRATQSKQKIN